MNLKPVWKWIQSLLEPGPTRQMARWSLLASFIMCCLAVTWLGIASGRTFDTSKIAHHAFFTLAFFLAVECWFYMIIDQRGIFSVYRSLKTFSWFCNKKEKKALEESKRDVTRDVLQMRKENYSESFILIVVIWRLVWSCLGIVWLKLSPFSELFKKLIGF
jgi:hypothetical protein